MVESRAFTWVIVLGGCGRASTTPPAPAPAPPVAPAPVAPVAPDGPCRALPDPAGDPDAPAAVASCPDPMGMSRGDGIGSSEDEPALVPSVLPPWDLDALRDYACAYACAPAGAHAYLLAWYADEDSRPLRNHNALFLVAHPGGTPPTWTVVVMYRHSWNKWWNIATPRHGRARPIVTFDHRPTAAEVDAVLHPQIWSFTDEGGFVIRAGNVIDELWPRATGSPAPRHFPDGIER